MVYALPLHHPLRVMEEICMLDHLSGGRLDIGFGRGSVPIEAAYYGENASVEERQQLYTERLDLILQAFAAQRLTFEGRRDRFSDVPMELKPLQRPHPPIWYGAHSPDSAERAARRRLNVINNDAPRLTQPTLERFRTVWRESLWKRSSAAEGRHGASYDRRGQRRGGARDCAARLCEMARPASTISTACMVIFGDG